MTSIPAARFNDAMPARKPTHKLPGKKKQPNPAAVLPNAPTPSRPRMPKGYHLPTTLEGSVPWAWASERLTKSHNYLITTVRPDGRPHMMVVWGIWLDNAYYFSTGATSRKAKNLATNPHCVICNENVEEAVIVEGEARQLATKDVPKPAFDLYFKKYGWKLDPKMGPIFEVKPRVVFAMPEKLFPAGATRWRF